MESIVLFFLAFLTCFLLLQWPVIFLCFRCCPSVCWSVTRTCMCFRCCLSVCWSVTRTCIMYVFQMLSQCLFGVSQEHVYVSDAVPVFVGVSQEHVSCLCFRCCLSVCLEYHKNMYMFQMLSQCLLECHKNMYHVCVSDAVSVFVGVSQEHVSCMCFRCCLSVCWSVTRTCMCFRCCLSVCWSVTRTCIMYVFQMLSQCLLECHKNMYHVCVSDAVSVFVGVSQEHVYVSDAVSVFVGVSQEHVYVSDAVSVFVGVSQEHVYVSDAVSVFVGVSQEQCRSWKASGSEGVCVWAKSPGKWWCNCPGCCFQGMLG